MAQQPPKRVSGPRGTRQTSQSSRPRGVFIAIGFTLLAIGAGLVFQNYSNNSAGLYGGLLLGALGVGITLFSPSRRRPHNGNHGRA